MNRTGTIKQLTSTLKFNGEFLNNVEFGILAKHLGSRFATATGTAPQPAGQRGKPATIWTLAARNLPLKVTEVEAVSADAPADATPVEDESATDEVVAQNDESANGVGDTEL